MNDMMFEVTDAKREMLIGSIAFMGPSGAGKTLSALKVASGMLKSRYPDLDNSELYKKIGVIDTEHSRSKIYADSMEHKIGSFKHLNFTKPYTVDRLDAAMKLLKEKHEVEIIIVDSISHFWEGDEGLLDLQQSKGGNFQAWREINPHYNHFIELVTGERYDIDTFSCIRSKQSYQMSTTETGKLEVQKLGLQPVQRDSLEYEFHITLSIGMDHVARSVKDNSGIFDGNPHVLGTSDGESIYKWLKSGEDVITERQRQRQREEAEKKKILAILPDYEVSDTMIAFIEEQREKARRHYNTDLEGLDLEVLKNVVRIIHAKKKQLEKESEQPKQEEAQHEESPQAQRSETDAMLGKINRYAETESVELAMYIQDLEEKCINKYKKKFNQLPHDQLVKVLSMIEQKRVELRKQIALQKQEAQKTYWYHPESDAVFTLGIDDPDPTDPMVEQIDKQRYDELLREEQAKDGYESLSDYTVKELREFAEAEGLTGFMQMKKAELIAALEAHRNEATA